jgi:hypothetical protein
MAGLLSAFVRYTEHMPKPPAVKLTPIHGALGTVDDSPSPYGGR